MATHELQNDKSIQHTNVKSITFEKGLKRKYTRNSKTDDKEKAIIDQMINEQTTEQINEQTNEQTNEQVIEQTIKQTTEASQRQIIEEEYDQRIHDLINSEGDHETRFANQQLAYRLERTRDDNIYLEIIQQIAELYMQEQDSKTIIERVKDAIINKVNYTKIGQQKGNKQKITGKLIDFSLMNDGNLCLVKTAHGGLRIQYNINNYRLPSNRNVKVATTDENGQRTKEIVQNRVVVPNTAVRETKNDQRITIKYEAVNDWENASHLTSLREILDKWNIDIKISYKDYAQQQHDRIYGVQIKDDGTIEQMNDELVQRYVDGLKNLDIHNYPQPINMEVSFL
ncbi:MAG: hypothetical protein EZS28_040938, partial [Streblomastix strix]